MVTLPNPDSDAVIDAVAIFDHGAHAHVNEHARASLAGLGDPVAEALANAMPPARERPMFVPVVIDREAMPESGMAFALEIEGQGYAMVALLMTEDVLDAIDLPSSKDLQDLMAAEAEAIIREATGDA